MSERPDADAIFRKDISLRHDLESVDSFDIRLSLPSDIDRSQQEPDESYRDDLFGPDVSSDSDGYTDVPQTFERSTASSSGGPVLSDEDHRRLSSVIDALGAKGSQPHFWQK